MAATRKPSEDADDYWGDSSARKGPSRRNIFDDDVSFETAKKILTTSETIDDEDEEEFDLVNWQGDPVVRYNNHKSASNAPDLSNLAVPITSHAARTTTLPPSAPSASYGKYDKPASMSHNRSQSLGGNVVQFGVNKAQMSRGVSDPSIEDVVRDASTPGKKQPTSAYLDKLQKEIIFLRKELQIAKRERWKKQPVGDTIRNMVLGQAYTFELYKSKEDKLALLDKAIESHDGNAIIAVILFVKKTIKASLFNLEMMRRPVAINHYLSYLKHHYDYAQMVDFLGMLGRSEEASMFKYKIACQSKDPTIKIATLKTCYRAHFQSEVQLGRQAALLQEQIDLLERQRPVEENDSHAEATGQVQIFRDFPRRATLFGQPVTTTLYYFCLYHYDLSENSLASPQALKARHNISDKQFLHCALGARAKMRRWKDIEVLLTAKGWFGGTKLKAVIGFDKVSEILHKNKAPHDVLAKYVALIEDLDQRLTIAHKVECPKAVIDALVALKDRAQLEKYSQTLRSHEALYAQDVLRSSSVKWK
ncbi:spermatogenesis-defective protein 39 homolog [Haliotis cracherodii]|uniref:spermatogenesis-defective protein 39 homolog n=1 Tax=Haliotis cracherodii TaxID=6455 RepID=UPI0039E7C97D